MSRLGSQLVPSGVGREPSANLGTARAMSWREAFLVWFGPGIFAGVTFGDWLALLAENRFAVDPAFWAARPSPPWVAWGTHSTAGEKKPSTVR